MPSKEGTERLDLASVWTFRHGVRLWGSVAQVERFEGGSSGCVMLVARPAPRGRLVFGLW